jgi:hypothetical protein
MSKSKQNDDIATISSIFKSNSLNNSKEAASSSPSRSAAISRAEKSLTALTTKFMTLLQESPNGVLDLRSVMLII